MNFCTLFDSGYLSRGLAMHASLSKYCTDFHLYIFAFDDVCFQIVKELNLQNVTVVSRDEFEDSELLKAKANRNAKEYIWTCKPSTAVYVLQNYKLDSCTYLEADLYFYSSSKVLFEEAKDHSVIITDHRYSPEYDQSARSGKYAAQFIYFKKNKEGLEAANNWRKDCNEWCYDRFEENKYGDQKYLESWAARFSGVHDLQHLGGGVGPWNMQQYAFHKENDEFIGTERKTGKSFHLVFVHFHNIRFFERYIDYSTYKLSRQIKKNLFRPYLKHLLSISKDIQKQFPDFEINYNATSSNGRSGIELIRHIFARYRKGLYNFMFYKN